MFEVVPYALASLLSSQYDPFSKSHLQWRKSYAPSRMCAHSAQFLEGGARNGSWVSPLLPLFPYQPTLRKTHGLLDRNPATRPRSER